MDNKVAISVIVPIYNMETLMRKCLDSILAQTFQDYECLLIDDGSKDGSSAICDEFAAKDDRIKAFHKPNGGLSDARNYGLERAHGEYTIFFDPDDWVDSDCLKELYNKAKEENADMVICDVFLNDQYVQIYQSEQPTELNHLSCIRDVFCGKLHGYTVNKLIRRECYSNFRLQFPLGIYGCEDEYVMCQLWKNDIKISYLPKAFYHYCYYGNQSSSRRYDRYTYKMDLKIRDMYVGLFQGTPLEQEAYQYRSSAIVNRAFVGGVKVFSSKEFKQIFSKYKDVLSAKYKPAILKPMIAISLNGYYHPMRFLYEQLFQMKQVYKKMRARIFILL